MCHKLIAILTVAGFLFLQSPATASEKISTPDIYKASTETLASGATIDEEASTWFSEKYNQKEYESIKKKIGWVYAINSKIRHVKKREGKVIYDEIYRTNDFGLRLLPNPPTPKKKHLIVAGDSNTFGFGVKEEETVPFLLSKMNSDYHGYNFGLSGSGPNNTLGLLEFLSWEKDIIESEGKMIYIFYPSWMSQRLIGTKSFFKWGDANSPRYELDKLHNLVYKGNFYSRLSTYFFKLINLIDIFKMVGELPKYSPEQSELTAKVLKKMKHEYLKKFSKGEFIVAVSHYYATADDHIPELVKMLESENVKVVQIHVGHMEKSEQRFLEFHFNNLGQSIAASELLRAIKL